MKILIIDDEQYICESISRNLSRIGFSVAIELNGKKALKTIEKEKPDIILLDLILGTVNGIDILKTVKRKYAHMIVIVITAKEDKQTQQEAFREGADDVLTKPFKTDYLKQTIRAKVEAIFIKKEKMQKPSVLIADDSDEYRKQISAFICNHYQVNLTEAKDGLEAVKEIKSKAFDLVVLDIKMPAQDGIGVLNEIKDIFPLSNIIVLSGWDDRNIILKIMNMRIFAYISKTDPEIFEILRDKVESLLISKGKLLKRLS